ncbi:uncharacterized protein [Diabrotica undecimpunctata]|uniref:uncharacterized protein n=1 Tax=Diabrotica undecimpunctata TaxID=50387 RepID=UPI003B6394EE
MKSVFVVVFFACLGIALSATLLNSEPTPDPDNLVCGVCFMLGNLFRIFKEEGMSKEIVRPERDFVCDILFGTDETKQICLDSFVEEVDIFYEVDRATVRETCIKMKKCEVNRRY